MPRFNQKEYPPAETPILQELINEVKEDQKRSIFASKEFRSFDGLDMKQTDQKKGFDSSKMCEF